jgi:hypothetical protein
MEKRWIRNRELSFWVAEDRAATMKAYSRQSKLINYDSNDFALKHSIQAC